MTEKTLNSAAHMAAADLPDGLFGAGVFIPNDRLRPAPRRDGPIRTAAYIRVSTDHENQEDSYALQEQYFVQLLADNPGWVSAGVYSDYGVSATDHTHRTGFNRLLRHCQEGKIDRVICKSISRFARNTADFMAALCILREHGVTILFEKENLDTAVPTSEFILTTLGAIAQEESRSISENQKWSIRSRLPKGEVPNRAIYGYRFQQGDDAYDVLETGYRIRKLEIVETEAAVIRRIFKEFLAGRSCSAIAGGLNLAHIPPPPRNSASMRTLENARRVLREAGSDDAAGGPQNVWTGGRVNSILRQVRYTGNVLAQKTYVESYLTHRSVKNDGVQPQYYIRAHHPAIITEEIFEEAGRIRRRNPCFDKTKVTQPPPFRKLLFCGRCGLPLNVRNTKNHPIWFCRNTSSQIGAGRCPSKRVYEAQILRMLRKAILKRFGLLDMDIRDDARTTDIYSGKCRAEIRFSERSEGFLGQMIDRLEKFQTGDLFEKDRAFWKRKLNLLYLEASRAEQNLRTLISRQGGPSGAQHRSFLADAELEVVRTRNRLEAEEAAFSRLEQYWNELEDSYDSRQKALQWMRTLSDDSKGLLAFLNGMESMYAKAFVLGVLVFDPLHFRVRWYDNTTTDVELFSNVDEGRGLSGWTRGEGANSEMREIPGVPQKKTLKISVLPATKRAVQAGGQLRNVGQLRVAAYCRVSTGDESQQTSYTGQKTYYTELISRREGWTMAGIFADEGISGTSTRRRAEFQRMMEEALAGKIDYIVTKSISRFARNTVDTLSCVRQLQEQDPPVGVYFEKENIDTLDAKGELILTILSALAQDESRSISDNIKWALQKNFQNGKAHLNPNRIFGFQEGPNGVWELCPEQAEVVRGIFQAYVAGDSATQIAANLNRRGCKTGRGKLWRADAILYILRNEKYVGDCEMQKYVTESYLTHRNVRNEGQAPRIYFTDHHVPIIDRATWEKTRAMLAAQVTSGKRTAKQSAGPRVVPFSNLTCSLCGGRMVKRSYHAPLREYSDERSADFDPETETEAYTMGYGVWRCEHTLQNGQKTDGPTCNSAPVLDLTLRQSFMELLYRIKQDCTAHGPDCDLMRMFESAIDRQKQLHKEYLYTQEQREAQLKTLAQLTREREELQARYLQTIQIAAWEQAAIGAENCGNEEIYTSLLNELEQRIETARAALEELGQEKEFISTMRKNYQLFQNCLQNLPETDPAGRKLRIHTIDQPTSEGQAHPASPDALAEAPDFLEFEKRIYLAFFERGVVTEDKIFLKTTFGVELVMEDIRRTSKDFLGFRRCREDGTQELLTRTYQVAERKIGYRRKKKQSSL